MYYNDGLDVPQVFEIKKREEEEKIRRMKLRRENMYKEIQRRKENKARKRKKVIKIVVGFGVVVVIAICIFQISLNNVIAYEENELTYSQSRDIDYNDEQKSFNNLDTSNELFESNIDIGNTTENLEEIVDVGRNYLRVRTIERYKDSSECNYFKSASSNYGIDINLLLAIGMTESSLDHYSAIPGGSKYNGFGVGMMQLETPSSDTVYAYNCLTNKKESLVCSLDNACDIKLNTQLGTMRLQNALNHNNGNIYLAIQEYNFGYGMMNSILKKMSEDTGLSIEQIKSNYSDLSFMKYVEDAHNNPSKYISGWRSSTYGNGEYLYDVLKNCPKETIRITYNGETFDFNLAYGVKTDGFKRK